MKPHKYIFEASPPDVCTHCQNLIEKHRSKPEVCPSCGSSVEGHDCATVERTKRLLGEKP